MILRRFTQHLKDQNWFAVGLEVIVLIVGIFLGMQVTEWNDERKEKQLEDEYLALLSRDLMAINKTLSEQLAHEQFIIEASTKALKYINNPDQEFKPVEFGQLLSQMWGRRTLTLQSPIFTELKSAGRLSIIRDNKLRNSIMEYFDSLVRTERVVDKNNNFQVEPFTAYLRDSGIGFVPMSDSQCKGKEGTVPCIFSKSWVQTVNGERTHSVESILGKSLSESKVSELRAQITYRGMAADSTRYTVTARLDNTTQVFDLISDYSKRN